VLDSEAEEVEAGEVPGSWERGEKAGVREGDIVGPELVTGSSEQAIENAPHLSRRAQGARVTRLAEKAEKGVLRERTGGPTAGDGLVLEKAQSGRFVVVPGITQGDERWHPAG
jgi:hypothetical protein